MSTRIKVLPVTEADIGIVHPLDGPLEAEGSLWTHDTFTERLLQAQAVRRFEAEAAPEPEAKPVKTAAR